MKKIEDYLHLYLGCDIMIGDEKSTMDIKKLHALYLFLEKYPLQRNVKPILHPLSSITKEVAMKLEYYDGSQTIEAYLHSHSHRLKPADFVYLLSKHFDLFGLIEAGLAIDVTKI